MRWSRSTRVSTTLRSGASRCSIVSVVAMAAVRVVNLAVATVDGTSADARTGVNSVVVMTTATSAVARADASFAGVTPIVSTAGVTMSGNFAVAMAGESFASESLSAVILVDATLATVSFADAGLRTVSFADAMTSGNFAAGMVASATSIAARAGASPSVSI